MQYHNVGAAVALDTSVGTSVGTADLATVDTAGTTASGECWCVYCICIGM